MRREKKWEVLNQRLLKLREKMDVVYTIGNFALIGPLDIPEGFWVLRHLPLGNWRCQSATHRIENKE